MYTNQSAFLYDYWHTELDKQEYRFFQRFIAQAQISLELGCGTGRLLLPLIQEGYHVEGIDCSADMLKICKSKAAQQKLNVCVYQQSIQNLNLPKQYDCIFSALETVQQIADRADAQKALRTVYDHLNAGGTFVVYLSIPWLYMPTTASDWRQVNEAVVDGNQYRLYEKSVHDPVEQVMYNSYRIMQENKMVQEYDCPVRWYSRYEFHDMLAHAGFESIQMQSGYTGDGPYDEMLFCARKKG